MKILVLILIMALSGFAGCKKSPKKNRVDLEQFQVDDSNDYRYIFRDTIREDERKRNRYKKDF